MLVRLAVVSVVVLLAACNTVNGAGEDIAAGGNAISRAATAAK